jgi:hypothetical protein
MEYMDKAPELPLAVYFMAGQQAMELLVTLKQQVEHTHMVT